MELTTGKVFIYQWSFSEDLEETTHIRLYGLDEKNESVYILVDDFTPYVYLELPDFINWSENNRTQLVCDKLNSLLGETKPLKSCLMYKKRLYYAHKIIKDGKEGDKLFPYLFMNFASKSDIKKLSWKIRQPLTITGLGKIKLRMHEQDATPILQLTCFRNIDTAGWIQYKGRKVVHKESYWKQEYIVKYKDIEPYECEIIPSPKIMGFDIEVNSKNINAMPKATNEQDKIFQISCVF